MASRQHVARGMVGVRFIMMSKIWRGYAVGLVALALGVAGARAQETLQTFQEYRMGSGDLVRVQVYQNPDLSLEMRITDAGTVSYPLLGVVRLSGMTVSGAERFLADRLKDGNFLRQPQVNVTLLQARGHQVSVLGQVNKPGRYALEAAGLRLTDVLAMAGGVAATGSDTVQLTGWRNGQSWRQEVDLSSLMAANASQRDPLMAHGDLVWVERQPQIYIYGEVQRPGQVRLERGMTLMQALASGGGLTPRGTERGIRVHRRAGEGAVQVLQPGLDDRLQAGDVVYVRESLF